jgi:AcrR family transcriptional regulator
MSARHATQTTPGPPAGRQLGRPRQRAIPRPGRRNAERKSKEQRRDEILDVATAVFAENGLHGASTEQIAKLAGISQPYVFRLFGTKKQLYLAVVARGFRQTLERMQQAAEGKRGREAPARPRADAAARTVELVGARAAAQIARTDQPQRDTRPQPKRS